MDGKLAFTARCLPCRQLYSTGTLFHLHQTDKIEGFIICYPILWLSRKIPQIWIQGQANVSLSLLNYVCISFHLPQVDKIKGFIVWKRLHYLEAFILRLWRNIPIKTAIWIQGQADIPLPLLCYIWHQKQSTGNDVISKSLGAQCKEGVITWSMELTQHYTTR